MIIERVTEIFDELHRSLCVARVSEYLHGNESDWHRICTNELLKDPQKADENSMERNNLVVEIINVIYCLPCGRKCAHKTHKYWLN